MHEVIPELLRFIGGRPIVGYYVDFDVAMLDKYVLPFIEAKLPNPRIDVTH
jgi:DNA polymerase-3 subunit epsilon